MVRGSILLRALLTSAALAGCEDFSSDPELLSIVTVSVVDDKNAGVAGIAVDLLLSDRTTVSQTKRTNSTGLGVFAVDDGAVIPQSFVVRVQMSGSGYLLAPGETNDKPVTLVVGRAGAVVFKVVRPTVTGT